MATALNLIGQQFGKLVVTERAENNKKGNTMWRCKCDCGNEKIALGYDLTHGRTVSCGCNKVGVPSKKRKDLTGMRSGTLTVISLCEERSKNGNLHWNCKCDCGADVVVSGGNLKSRECSHRLCPLRNHPYNFIDLTGMRFGRLTVIEEYGKADGKVKWLCRCDCGNTKVVCGQDLKSGSTKSCGCLLEEQRHAAKHITHGMSGTKLYRRYSGMIARCSENNRASKNYAEKGVRVCDEWLGEHGFENFMKWSYENGYSDDKHWTEMTIDRIDNDGIYEPSNCRWTTAKQQCNNMSTNVNIEYNGKTQTMKQWCEELNLNYTAIKARHRKGIAVPELFYPVQSRS